MKVTSVDVQGDHKLYYNAVPPALAGYPRTLYGLFTVTVKILFEKLLYFVCTVQNIVPSKIWWTKVKELTKKYSLESSEIMFIDFFHKIGKSFTEHFTTTVF